MALARKCDRCGRLYNHYPIVDTPGTWNAVSLVRTGADGSEISRKSRMDLCTYCMNDLQTFLRNSDMEVKEKSNDEK